MSSEDLVSERTNEPELEQGYEAYKQNLDKLKTLLVELGLKEGETRLYLTGLEVGPATIRLLSDRTGLPRASIYFLLDKLIKKGLVYEKKQGWKKRYCMSRPEHLLALLEAKKTTLIANFPNFPNYTSESLDENEFNYFYGLEGVKHACELVLQSMQSQGSYKVLTDIERWFDLDKDYFNDLMKRRAQKAHDCSLTVQALLTDCEVAHQLEQFQAYLKMDIDLITPKLLNSNLSNGLKSNILITNKMVVLYQLHEPLFAVVITNKNAILMYEQMFDLIKGLQKQHKNSIKNKNK